MGGQERPYYSRVTCGSHPRGSRRGRRIDRVDDLGPAATREPDTLVALPAIEWRRSLVSFTAKAPPRGFRARRARPSARNGRTFASLRRSLLRRL
jgi:hypothetical protein